jgi:uncharacterized membrane protein YbhN (UPF0104 family)
MSRITKLKISTIVNIVVVALFLITATWFIVVNKDAFINVNVVPIFFAVPFAILSIWLNGQQIKISLTAHHVYLKEPFWLVATSSWLNLVSPVRAGIVFRAWFLKMGYQLTYYRFITSVGGLCLVTILNSSFVVLLVIIYLSFSNEGGNLSRYLALFSSIIAITLVVIILSNKIKLPAKFDHLLHSWRSILGNQRILFGVAAYQLVYLISESVFLMLIFQSINIDVGILGALLITAISSILLFISFTPGGIGLLEAYYIFVGFYMGIAAEDMFTLAIIRRGIDLIVLTIFGFFGKLLLDRRIRDK